MNTKVAAQEKEREVIARLLAGAPALVVIPALEKREVPTVQEFVKEFMGYAQANNKPAEIESKEMILRRHLLPMFGRLRLDEVGERNIEAFKTDRIALGLNKKTINNHLTVLRRMLGLARRFKLIAAVPEVIWLKAPKPEFDFLTFEESERLVKAADSAWRTMIFLGLRTGLRQGELLGLRWEDVDLVAGRLNVRQAISRGLVGTPKNGRSREIALSDQTVQVLKDERHLRGPVVFCDADGQVLRKTACKCPLWRACRRAGLRRIGWHVLRHYPASRIIPRRSASAALLRRRPRSSSLADAG